MIFLTNMHCLTIVNVSGSQEKMTCVFDLQSTDLYLIISIFSPFFKLFSLCPTIRSSVHNYDFIHS